MLYVKKPVVIEAFRLGMDYMPDWFMKAITKNEVILHKNIRDPIETEADIKTLEGWIHASGGDYIIQGIKDEIYPCKADIFEMTYDALGV